MADENKEVVATTGPDDLEKTLDDAMKAADAVLAKSKEDDSFLKALSNPETRKKAMEYMKKNYKEEDEEEEDEEEEVKGKGKDKMKKSLDTIAPEVIDANPILGQFIDILKTLESKIDSFTGKLEAIETMQKSFGDVSIASANLLKTLKTDVIKVGEIPLPVKGKTEILKTEKGEELPKTVISDTLLKCAQGNKIAYTDFARCEMSGWDINVLTKSAKDTLVAELKKGGLL